MKQNGLLAATAVCAALVLPGLGAAQTAPATPPSPTAPATGPVQVPIPKTAAEVPGPVPGNTMTDAYVQLVGRMAYLWGYPMVNAHNRRAAFAEAPAPGLLGGVVPVAPVGYNQMLTDYLKPDQTFIVCPNQDVAYGAGFTALDKEPTVIQVPDFGDRFYVYAMYDQRTDEIGRIGKQYGTKPGFYMIVGPSWTGETAQGHHRGDPFVHGSRLRRPADLQGFDARGYRGRPAGHRSDRDVSAQPVRRHDEDEGLRQVAAFSGPGAVAQAPKGESKWVNPETYYDELRVVMKEVPPLPGEEALYGWIASVWDAAAKNPDTKKALVESFVAAEKELVEPLFQFQYNGRAVGNGWTVPANAAAWGTDYLNRTAISKSSMYQNTSAETQYNLREFDSEGKPLDGNHQYTVTFAEGTSPAREGVLVVDPVQRGEVLLSECAEPLLARHQEQDAEIRRGRLADPLPGREVAGQGERSRTGSRPPTGHFSLILRLYWPEASVLSGTWLPPDIKKVN